MPFPGDPNVAPPPCDNFCDLYDDGRQVYDAYSILIGFKAIQVFVGVLNLMAINEKLGVLLIMITESMTPWGTNLRLNSRVDARPCRHSATHAFAPRTVFSDMFLWLQLYGVVTAAFMIAGAALQISGNYNPVAAEPNGDLNAVFEAHGNFWAPVWLTYGFFDPINYEMGDYGFISALVAWCYLFISCIVLVNLLVVR